ncbi:MAG: hypothetical protein ACT4QE_15945 [Anaerolineales bacterium]
METLGTLSICAGFIFVFIGTIIQLTQGMRGASATPRTNVAPPTNVGQRPTPTPTLQRAGGTMHDRYTNARPGQTATFQHPKRGELNAKILGVIEYSELTQKQRGGNAPWVPTGNNYVALWMGDYMLYEWQDRLYLFDEAQAITEQQINESFLPAAKQFGQSGQTAKVTVAWPPLTWTVADIGRFGVTRVEGEGLRLSVGAQGRFIHATGEDDRVLAVEDYQSGGGGLDTVWLGWKITWDAMKKID